MQFNHSAFETLCAKETFNHAQFDFSHNLPIFSSSTFIYESPKAAMNYFSQSNENEHMNIYSRWANPTVMALEDKLAAIESFGSEKEAYCCCFGSGMGAISSAILAFTNQNKKVLTQANLYGTTTELFRKTLLPLGIEPTFADLTDLSLVEQLLNDNEFQLIYLETPSNPDLSCVDIHAIVELAKLHNCKVIVDNTFNTAYTQQPLLQGVDVVVHSTTKFLNGHGSSLGGAVISFDKEYIKTSLWTIRKTLGGVLSPFDAYLTYNGLKTLPLRMKKHIENASEIADYLVQHNQVEKVNYLGLEEHKYHKLANQQMYNFGSMISFELKDGLAAGEKLMQSIQLLTLTSSLGTTDTLISHPASMTHAVVPKEQREQFGINDGLIRLSVGIEGVDDIIADLDQALQA